MERIFKIPTYLRLFQKTKEIKEKKETTRMKNQFKMSKMLIQVQGSINKDNNHNLQNKMIKAIHKTTKKAKNKRIIYL